MKRYKLIKDLPTFKAGDTFHIENDGCLYLDAECARGDSGHWSHHVMAYHKNTLDRFPNILADWFEEIESSGSEYEERISTLEQSISNLRQQIGAIMVHYFDLEDRIAKLEGQKND